MEVSLSLRGRRVVVLGVGTGMGRSISLTLASLGATVILASRDVERLKSICSETAKHGADCHAYKVDVTSPAQLKDLARIIEERHGGATDLVYNAGGYFSLDKMEDITEEFFDQALALNLKGFFYAVKAFLSQVRRSKGSIIAISASPATILAGNIAYVASKGGLNWMIKKLAKELASEGVRVNCVAPGPTSHDPAPLETSEAKLRTWEQHPASDVGWTVALLVTKAMPRLTGECITIDGGLSIP